jgi:hypothetical protein
MSSHHGPGEEDGVPQLVAETFCRHPFNPVFQFLEGEGEGQESLMAAYAVEVHESKLTADSVESVAGDEPGGACVGQGSSSGFAHSTAGRESQRVGRSTSAPPSRIPRPQSAARSEAASCLVDGATSPLLVGHEAGTQTSPPAPDLNSSLEQQGVPFGGAW